MSAVDRWLELARRLLAAARRPPLRDHIPHGPRSEELEEPSRPAGQVPTGAPSLRCRWCQLTGERHVNGKCPNGSGREFSPEL